MPPVSQRILDAVIMNEAFRVDKLELFCELQEFKDMFGDADGVAVLFYDLDFCDSLAGFFVHRDDLVIAGDRVAKIDRTRKAHMIIAIRSNGTFLVVRLVDEG